MDKIQDMRGSGWSANYIDIKDGKLYYCGYRVLYLTKKPKVLSRHMYNIISNCYILGEIALTEESLAIAQSILKSTNMHTYISKRTRVIAEFLNAVHTEFGDDRKRISQMVDLTVGLEIADPDEKFVDDLLGFMTWCTLSNQSVKTVIETISHDLSYFTQKVEGFCPRTSGYSKYLSGASNVSI